MKTHLEKFKSCLQKEIPFCQAECPFHLDILDFMEKMKRGGYNAAYKTYRNAVGFPLIVSELCPEPCKGICPRRDLDSPIQLKMLELAAISFSDKKEPTAYNLPAKPKKIAVIGAGISGLACALRLCMKKYEVEIYEAENRIGGSLWEMLPSEVFLKDIEEQFKHEKYILHLNTRILSSQDLGKNGGFDAVYVATGKDGLDFGLLDMPKEAGQNPCKRIGPTGWFAGGGLIGEEPIIALATGLYMGTVIDNFLKTDKLIYPKNIQTTDMCLDPIHLKRIKPVLPEDGNKFSEEEAIREANRCIECKCDACRQYCDLTDFYNKWPLRIRDEIIATTLPGSAEVKATPAKRLLSTCNQCGLCKETCPEDIDLGGLILEGRKSMHRQEKTAWVFHDFWLRDMEFANGNLSAMAKIPNEIVQEKEEIRQTCNFAFFPGCQLGASDPHLVEKAYQYLMDRNPETGILLRCCGVPAQWSGDEEKFDMEIQELRSQWISMGKPILIVACPTCLKKFKECMDEIPVISLYEIMAEWGFDFQEWKKGASGKLGWDEKIFSVFDPCASIYEKEMQQAVRTLAVKAGISLIPLLKNEAYPHCCSFGGQSAIANPEYAEFVRNRRISEGESPYIAYCINCRDIFRDGGKETVHILDILFGEGVLVKKLATVSERRENRILLKNRLLKDIWNQEPEVKKIDPLIGLIISEPLVSKLNEQRILEEDIMDVVAFCETTGRKVYNPKTQSYKGYKEIGFTTYWVEYKEASQEKMFDLLNAYSHRMKIELETVWNGEKYEQI